MKNQKELLLELQSKIEVEKFNFENLFKNANKSLDEFLKEYYSKIRSTFAKHSTDALHSGFLNNIKSEEFINDVLKANIENVFNLLNSLKEIENKK